MGTSFNAGNHIVAVIQKTNEHITNQNFLRCGQSGSVDWGADDVRCPKPPDSWLPLGLSGPELVDSMENVANDHEM